MKWMALPPLSREGRDTLWLLAALLLSLAPHLPRLPLWCSGVALGAIAWRAHLAWRDAPPPPRWVLVLTLIACLVGTWWTHRTLLGREAGVTLVTTLAALKTLELRARRDALVITSLGFFLILTQFLYSQSIGLALLMLLAVLAWLTSLVLAQRPLGRPPLASAWWAASRSLALGLPLMVALYLFFPRFGPLWSVPSDAGPRTGLSDEMQLGHVAELALDDRVAMRVRFAGPAPASDQLYFRGPVLEWFDGQRWTASPARRRVDRQDGADVQPSGSVVRYEVTLEPNRLRSVPLLEGTVAAFPQPPLTEPAIKSSGIDWTVSRPLMERSQFEAQARLGTRHGLREPESRLARLTWLPPGLNPRTVAWAHALAQRTDLVNAPPDRKVLAVLQHIRTQNYHYTLNPEDDLGAPPSPDRHQIDRFWLDRRQGFCEHFASAFVVVMRAMGIPARVVTGYQGAEFNPFDGYHVVRNSDAHAWAEYWMADRGWVRIDPTAAVAPERIERSRNFGNRPGDARAGMPGLTPQVWSRMRAYLEAGNHRWDMWVQGYSRQQQLAMLKDWGLPSPDWTDLLRICVAGTVLASLGGALWLWWKRPRTWASPWHTILQRVHVALSELGLPAPTDCPAPAPASAWSRIVCEVHAPGEQSALRDALLTHLSRLDELRYAASPEAPVAQLRTGRAQARAIVQLARQWRTLRARGTVGAH